MLIVFKLPELPPSCSIISVISINDSAAADGELLDLRLKIVSENSVCKEPCVLKEKIKIEIKLNFEHLL